MLTPYLEKLIHEGKARFRTFVCGQSGSNVLPVSDNSWIIITGFTYCNFSDPALPLNLPINFDEYVARSIHQLRFRSSKSNNHYILKDDISREPGSPGSDINQIVNGDFANGANNWILGIGWSIGAGAARHTGVDIDNLVYVPLTTLKGRNYRLTFEVIAVSGVQTVQPFLGNQGGFIRSTAGVFTEEFVNVQPGRLEFKGDGLLAATIDIDNIELILLPSAETILINGHYKFDCYLPHQNEVSVELVGFGPFSIITDVSAAAPASLHLPAPPSGYGNAGFGGIAQVSEFIANDGFFAYGNLPLTRIHSVPSGGAATMLNGMEISVNLFTAINNPVYSEAQKTRDFPIVDVQYVEIEGNMPGNIQASN